MNAESPLPLGLESLTVRLQTRRYVVRTLSPDDVGPDYAAWFESPAVQRNISWQPIGDPINELLRYVAEHLARKDSLLLGVFSLQGKHVANLKYEPIDFLQKCATLGALVGDSASRGKGLFKEVFPVTASFLRKDLGVTTINLKVNAQNIRALTAYENAGFRRVSTSTSGGIKMEYRLL